MFVTKSTVISSCILLSQYKAQTLNIFRAGSKLLDVTSYRLKQELNWNFGHQFIMTEIQNDQKRYI